MKTSKALHCNSTIRDFFEAQASTETAELADHLPDHLFQRSLTSPDEKFSVSRFVYSNCNNNNSSNCKDSDKKTPLNQKYFDIESGLIRSRSQHITGYSYYADRLNTSNGALECDCMGEDEKIQLYKDLLQQNIQHDDRCVLRDKHRRLMLDFQTRRNIQNPNSVVLPDPAVLQNESINGVQGRIIYMKRPQNQIKPTFSKDLNNCNKNHPNTYSLSNRIYYRPKSVPSTLLTQRNSVPSLINLHPSSSLESRATVNGFRRVKSGVSRTNARYHRLLCQKTQRDTYAYPDTKHNDKDLIIHNDLPKESHQEMDLRSSAVDDDLLSSRIFKSEPAPTPAPAPTPTPASSPMPSSSPTPTATPTPTQTPRMLTLRVTLPREIEEVARCNLPDSDNQLEDLVITKPTPTVTLGTDLPEKPNQRSRPSVSSQYGISRNSMEFLSRSYDKGEGSSSDFHRFKYTKATPHLPERQRLNLTKSQSFMNGGGTSSSRLHPNQSQGHISNGGLNYQRSNVRISPSLRSRLDGYKSKLM